MRIFRITKTPIAAKWRRGTLSVSPVRLLPYLDSVTFDRIAAVTDEKIKERVKEACCAVADVLLQKEQRDGIASETNDGISVTYTTEGSTDEQRLYRAAVLYLSNTGLLYRGVE